MTGDLASSDFVLDTTPFGGERTDRTDGVLDVDPSIWYGIETVYRLSDRFSISGSWMHARSRFRVEYPALSRDEGAFDLEGLILAGQDFTNAAFGTEATSAMNDAVMDAYVAALVFETPVFDRWAFPYVSLGAGAFKLKSDGYIIETKYKGDPPPTFEALDVFGIDPFEASGIPRIALAKLDPLVTLGFGMRASISRNWGADLQFEDLVRLGTDQSVLDSATDDVDPDAGVLLQTVFRGRKGNVHNFGIRLSVNYAFWPFNRPR